MSSLDCFLSLSLNIALFYAGTLPTVKQDVSIAEVLLLRLLPACHIIVVVVPNIRLRILCIGRVMSSRYSAEVTDARIEIIKVLAATQSTQGEGHFIV